MGFLGSETCVVSQGSCVEVVKVLTAISNFESRHLGIFATDEVREILRESFLLESEEIRK